jgi:spermidine/putrescine transport system substrate-binding protein
VEQDRLLQRMSSKQVSRRGVLGAAGAAALLAACGGVETNNKSGTTPQSRVPSELESELSVYNWVDYVHPKTYKQFRKEFDVDLTEANYASNEEALAKLQAGARGYDVIAPTGYMVEIMAGEGLLFELDKSKIPNFSGVESTYTDLPFDPGNKYSVPKDFGTTGYGYRPSLVKEEMSSWEDFYRLASKYSGRYTVLDSPPEVIGSALKMLGYSYNTTDVKEIDEATKEIIKLKPHIRKITSSMRELLGSGEAYVSLTWNGEVYYATLIKGGEDSTYVLPSEGTEIWLDNWSILAEAPHPALAHAFLNWHLQPRVQAQDVSYHFYGSPVEGEEEFLDPAIFNDPTVYPPPDVASKMEIYEADVERQRLRNEAWTKFKAA